MGGFSGWIDFLSRFCWFLAIFSLCLQVPELVLGALSMCSAAGKTVYMRGEEDGSEHSVQIHCAIIVYSSPPEIGITWA